MLLKCSVLSAIGGRNRYIIISKILIDHGSLLFLFAFLFFWAGKSFSQSDSLQRQINEQVWKPFILGFNSDDDVGFQSVHSRDLVRVEQDASQILGYDQYFKKLPDSIKKSWGQWKKKIELRFLQRIAANGMGFEVGYYKTTSTNLVTGESRAGYGKFHVLLRVEDGRWKILIDADARENTDEKVFLSGKPLD